MNFFKIVKCLLFGLALLLCNVGFGQNELTFAGKSILELRQKVVVQGLDFGGLELKKVVQKPSFPSLQTWFSTDEKALPPMPRAWSYEQLGFFCKLDIDLEKKVKMPVKFRLGEVQYEEALEKGTSY